MKAHIFAVFSVFTFLINVTSCQNVSVWVANSPGRLVYQVTTVGTNLSVQCKTKSAGADITWSKYPSSERITIKKSQERIYTKIVADGIISLNIDAVTKEDSGVFRCLAEKDGKNVSSLLNVTVYDSNFCGFESGDFCDFYDSKGASSIFDLSAFKEPDLAALQVGNGQVVQSQRNQLTGPSYDITLGPQYHNGKYVYLSSGTKKLHRYGMLISFLFNSTETDRCFSFWYHAWGTDVGKVAVSRLAYGTDPSQRTTLETVLGSQGNTWKLFKVAIPSIDIDYRLIIELEKHSGGNYGDIAIDDVRWFDAPCNVTDVPDLWDKLKTPIRLVNGTKSKEGRVEVFHEGEWGTISGATNDIAAAVICNALEYGEKRSTLKRNAFFGEGNNLRVWVGGLNCSGTERDPMACRVGKFEEGKHYEHSEDIGVVCIDECDSYPCGRTNGECSNTASGYDCRCNFGFSGQKCENKVESEVQLVETERNDTSKRVEVKFEGKWQTICPMRWTNAEARVVCVMKGFNESIATALTDSASGPAAFNTTDWTLHCEGTEADLVSCQVIPVHPGFECKGKYSGVICNDFCASNPCLNEGNCTNFENGFNCTCPPGIFGSTCNKDGVDDCVSNQCSNGSTCLDGVKGYTCKCPVGKEGNYCNQNVNFCASNPCKNDRDCTSMDDDFKCDCGLGWTGKDCGEDVDECIHMKDPCFNVSCVNLNGTYGCKCPIGGVRKNCSDTTLPVSKKCPEMPDIAHGTVMRYPNYLKYSCDDGYSLNATMPTKECHDGSWIPDNSPQCLTHGGIDKTNFTLKTFLIQRYWKGQYIYLGASFDFTFQVSSMEKTFYGNVTGIFQDNISPMTLTGLVSPPNRIKLKPLKKSGDPLSHQPDWVLEGSSTYVKDEWRFLGNITSAGFGQFYMVPIKSNTVIKLPEDNFNPKPNKAPEKSSKKTVAVVLPIVFLLAVVVCGIAYYFYRNGRFKNSYYGATRFENPLYEQ